MAQEQGRKGFIERSAGFFEKLHYGIGAIAVAGAVIFESATLGTIAAYEVLHGLVWRWIKNKSAKVPKPKAAPA